MTAGRDIRAPGSGLVALAMMLAGCAGLGGQREEQAPSVPVSRVEQQALPPVGAAPAPQTAAEPAAAAPPGAQQPSAQPASLFPGASRPGAVGGPPGSAAAVAAGGGFTPMNATNIGGEWNMLDRGGTSQCRIRLSLPVGGAPGDATPSGCVSEQLFRVARWQSRGDELVLLDERNAPLVLMRAVGRGRYEGVGTENERFAIWR